MFLPPVSVHHHHSAARTPNSCTSPGLQVFPPGLQQGDNISMSSEMVEMRLPPRRGQQTLYVPWWEMETSTMVKTERWTTAPALADLHPQDRASATKCLGQTEGPVHCPVYIFSLTTKSWYRAAFTAFSTFRMQPKGQIAIYRWPDLENKWHLSRLILLWSIKASAVFLTQGTSCMYQYRHTRLPSKSGA